MTLEFLMLAMSPSAALSLVRCSPTNIDHRLILVDFPMAR